MDKEPDGNKCNHPPEKIRDYIVENYPVFANASGINIGVLGNHYRVIVTDSQKVNHTLHIDPQEIDQAADEKIARAIRARQQSRDEDQDRER
jgi:hypothetical protein